MSAATASNPPNSLERYRSEAAKKAAKLGGPFRFHVSDDEVLEIPRPTGEVVFELEVATSSKEMIKLLAGDQAGRLIEIFEGEDFEVMQAVSNDIMEHFGIENPNR